MWALRFAESCTTPGNTETSLKDIQNVYYYTCIQTLLLEGNHIRAKINYVVA
jgi:hypothetical protein